MKYNSSIQGITFLFLGECERLSASTLCPDALRGWLSFLMGGYLGLFFLCHNGHGVDLTTLRHLKPKLRMAGAVSSFPPPPYAFMA